MQHFPCSCSVDIRASSSNKTPARADERAASTGGSVRTLTVRAKVTTHAEIQLVQGSAHPKPLSHMAPVEPSSDRCASALWSGASCSLCSQIGILSQINCSCSELRGALRDVVEITMPNKVLLFASSSSPVIAFAASSAGHPVFRSSDTLLITQLNGKWNFEKLDDKIKACQWTWVKRTLWASKLTLTVWNAL